MVTTANFEIIANAIKEKGISVLHRYRETGGNLADCDRDGNTLLHLATHFDDNTVLEYLLSEACQGLIDINARNHRGETALHSILYASIPTKTLRARLQKLIEAGADVNAFDKGSLSSPGTPLFFLLARERFGEAEILLSIAPDASIQEGDFSIKREALKNYLSSLSEETLDTYPSLYTFAFGRDICSSEQLSARRARVTDDSKCSNGPSGHANRDFIVVKTSNLCLVL